MTFLTMVYLIIILFFYFAFMWGFRLLVMAVIARGAKGLKENGMEQIKAFEQKVKGAVDDDPKEV